MLFLAIIFGGIFIINRSTEKKCLGSTPGVLFNHLEDTILSVKTNTRVIIVLYSLQISLMRRYVTSIQIDLKIDLHLNTIIDKQ